MSQAFTDLVPPSAPRFIPSHDEAVDDESAVSAVSWSAIAAGAVACASLALIMLALGTGAGLSALSPWAPGRFDAGTVGTGALIWFVIVQLVSGALGGYLAGRLRTRWTGTHDHEVYFRDTAHGFVAWGVALLLSAAFLTTAATAMVGIDTRDGMRSDQAGVPYFVGRLFRSDQPLVQADSSIRAEAGAIMMHDLRGRAMPDDDRRFLASAVATRTGLGSNAADQRVIDTFGQAQRLVDDARRAAAHALYWLFVALLVGAFSASLAATFGGRRRDRAHLPA